MTQPVFEPTDQRHFGNLSFGERQLRRRPAPVTAGVSPVAYAVMEWTEGATIPDDALTELDGDITGVDWTDGYINPAGLALTPTPFDFDFHEGLITFSSSGLYHAEFQAQWAATWPSTTVPSYILTQLIYFGNTAVAGNAGSWSSQGVMFNEQEWQQTYSHAVGHVVSVSDDEVLSSFAGAVMQKSGGGKFLSTCALIVTKLADFDADTGEFLPFSS